MIGEIKSLAFFEFFQDWVVSMLAINLPGCDVAEDDMCFLVLLKRGVDRLGSDSFLRNAGVLIPAAVVMSAAAVGTVILYSTKSLHAKIRKLYIKAKTILFWNSFIRYVLQSTLKLQIAAATVLVLE